MTIPAIPSAARRRLPVLVLVLVLVVSGLLLWRTLRDGRPAAGVGTVLAAADPIEGGKRFVVRVPGTAYDVTARVRDDVPDDVAVGTFQAPDGGRFVGVSITPSAQVVPDVPTFSRTSRATKPSATLVVGTRRYALTDASGDTTDLVPSAFWVAVAGDARSVRLEFTWGGKSQSLDLRTGEREARDFAPLYRTDAGDASLVSCGAFAWTPGYRADVGQATGCRFAADRVPYVAGNGWAAKGSQWLVLRVVTSPAAGFVHRVGARDVRYYGRSTDFPSGDERLRHRLDGRAALASYRYGLFAGDGSRSDALLFSVPSGSAAHTATFVQRVQGFGRSVDSVVEVSQTWTVRV